MKKRDKKRAENITLILILLALLLIFIFAGVSYNGNQSFVSTKEQNSPAITSDDNSNNENSDNPVSNFFNGILDFFGLGSQQSQQQNQQAQLSPSNRIDPSDLQYLGAFKINLVGNRWNYVAFNYNAGGIDAYYPNGDPSGPNDGYPGSLYAAGHTYLNGGLTYEINIPAPINTGNRDLSELNSATVLQSPQSVVNLNADGSGDSYWGVEYLPSSLTGLPTDKLFHLIGKHFEDNVYYGLLWSTLNLASPNTAGKWRVNNITINWINTNHYSLTIPKTWADAHANSRYLGIGRFREGKLSAGPTLVAIAPWAYGNPPPDKTIFTETDLLNYGNLDTFICWSDPSKCLNDFNYDDDWEGAVWADVNGKQSVIFSGNKGLVASWYGWRGEVCDSNQCAFSGNSCSSNSDCNIHYRVVEVGQSGFSCSRVPNDGIPCIECDGGSSPACTTLSPQYGGGNRGYRADAYVDQLLFYDPDDLAKVANGTWQSWQPQPYARLNITQYMFDYDPSLYPKIKVGAMAIDNQRGLLYVTEVYGDKDPNRGDPADVPIVHVFKINSGPSVPLCGNGICDALESCNGPNACSSDCSCTGLEPYPRSTEITGISWNTSSKQHYASGSDNWPTTWAQDGNLYSSWGDGGGFGGDNSLGRVSLGFARITGNSNNYQGFNVWGGLNPENPATFSGKSYGVIAVDGNMYKFVTPGSGNEAYADNRLAKSTDNGSTWQQASWSFVPNCSGCSTADVFSFGFIQFGQNNQYSPDPNYVYAYSIRLESPTPQGYPTPADNGLRTQRTSGIGSYGEVDLFRASKAGLASNFNNMNNWEAFAGFDNSTGLPIWTTTYSNRVPVFRDLNGVSGHGVSGIYYPPLNKYILMTEHNDGPTDIGTSSSDLGIFESDNMWGPWKTVAYYNNWLTTDNGFFWNIAPKWINGDKFTLVYTGTEPNFNINKASDALNTIDGQFTLAGVDITPPTTPTGLATTPTSSSQINLNWNAASDPESGVSSYKIYRNSNLLTTITSTSYSDTNLNESTTYSYQVSAVNGQGLESSLTSVVQGTTQADTTRPTVSSVITNPGDATHVVITYSEAMGPSATTTSNYAINGSISVTGASLSTDQKTVTLTTSSHIDGNSYKVTISNVRDKAVAQNLINPNPTNTNYNYINQLVISNLVASSGLTYQVDNNLQTGDLIYIDRTYTWTTVPSTYLGKVYIRTANADKALTAANHLSFTINQNANVYVAYDDRITPKPTWLTSSFVDTGANLVSSDGSTVFSLYNKSYSAGSVVLGGNGDSSQSFSMYGVVIQAAGSSSGGSQTCGNGIIEGTEVCDDGDTSSGDGCSSSCTVESGWQCNLQSPTTCFQGAPYPLSNYITATTWDSVGSVIVEATGSDNWPITWADDGDLYTAYGDGWGFDPQIATKLSLGFGKVQGNPPSINGINIRSATGEQLGDGSAGKKASGMLMVDNTLYMWVRNANLDGTQCQLAWSTDHSSTWSWSPWKFTNLGYCAFLNFGQNYSGARDSYVYMYSPNTNSAYLETNEVVLTRVLKTQIQNQASYEYFTGLDASNNSLWSTNANLRKSVFNFTGGANRLDVVYDAPINRYLLTMRSRAQAGGLDQFSIYEAPEPWGPWKTVFYTTGTGWDMDPGEVQHFPSKWISADGKRLYMVLASSDTFSVRGINLTISSSSSGPVCGNGVIESGEQCDLTQLNGQSCSTQGFDSGTLSCNPTTCQFDTSSCTITSTTPLTCDPLPASTGNTIPISAASQLISAISTASPGDILLLANGTYNLGGNALQIQDANLVIRSQSGNRDSVILDGQFSQACTDCSTFIVESPGVTFADVTIKRSPYHGIHVKGSANNFIAYNVKFMDEGQQYLKVTADGNQYSDNGLLACSYFEMTSEGRNYVQTHPSSTDCYVGGIDAHTTLGWVVRDNMFQNIYCDAGFSPAEHAIHFWKENKDTIVERNLIINSDRGIGFGLSDGSTSNQRIPWYSPDPLQGSGLTQNTVDHVNGVIRNNIIYANTAIGFDTGIGLESAYNVSIYHNTIYSDQAGALGIDLRFPGTKNTKLANNLIKPSTISLRNSPGTPSLNVNNLAATSGMFVNLGNNDLHLVSSATTAINQGTNVGVTDDIDRDTRDSQVDIGADEYISGASDTTNPIISGVTDNPDPVVQGNVITISATVTDNIAVSNVRAEVDGSTNITMTNSGGSTYQTTSAPTSSLGTHTYKIIAFDSSNNKAELSGFSYSVSTAPDTTAPVITNILDNDPVDIASNLVITADVTDNSGSLTFVRAEFDGTTNFTMTNTGGNSYQLTRTASSIGVGSHTYKIIAQDPSGNKQTSSPISFSIVNSCTLTSASWATTTAFENQNVQFTLSGTNCNGQQISVAVFEDDLVNDDNVNVNPNPVTFVGGTATGTWTAEWQLDLDDPSNPPEYYVRATGPNNAISTGNLLTVYTTNLPVISLNSPLNNSSLAPGNINFNCTSYSDNGVKNTTLIVNGVNRATVNSDSLTQTLSFTTPGTYGWNCRAYDNLNNNSVHQTGYVFNILDVTNPSITNPTDNPDPVTQGNNITISANVNDNIAVSNVRVELDNTINYTMNNVGGTLYQVSRNTSSLSLSTHTYKIIAFDTSSNKAESSGTFVVSAVPDTIAPIISNVTNTTTQTSAVIQWDTSELSNSTVRYGLTSNVYTNIVQSSSLVNHHSLTINSLTASTTYYYKISSGDVSGNIGNSSEYSFTTPSAPDTTPPVISNVTNSSITENSAVINWNTNENANSIVFYGLTSGTYTSNVSDLVDYSTSHAITLTGLTSNTTYYYIVNSSDVSGNSAISSQFNFTTNSTATNETTNNGGDDGSSGGSGGGGGGSGGGGAGGAGTTPQGNSNGQTEPNEIVPLINLVDSVSLEQTLGLGQYSLAIVSGIYHDFEVSQITQQTTTIMIDGILYELNLNEPQSIFLDGYTVTLNYLEQSNNNARLSFTKEIFLPQTPFNYLYLTLGALIVITSAVGAAYFIRKKNR